MAYEDSSLTKWVREIGLDHRVSIERKCPCMKKLKGKVTSPRTLTIMTSHTYKSQLLVLNLATLSKLLFFLVKLKTEILYLFVCDVIIVKVRGEDPRPFNFFL